MPHHVGGGSCPQKLLMGGIMGACIGGAMGALFGVFETFQTKQFNPARFGKAAAGSAAAFGVFMAVGTAVRTC
eukprot:EC715644.1.p2 GENE.EC715644.1~~EC715644.1.p2  ORF type:complete len:73 (+),score=0.42 EC715644.1:30-248(+)